MHLLRFLVRSVMKRVIPVVDGSIVSVSVQVLHLELDAGVTLKENNYEQRMVVQSQMLAEILY